MLELLLPFLASVLITLLLRQMDKSNLNLRKLKNFMERGQKELQEIASAKKEELKDATTRFDMLLMQSDQQVKLLLDHSDESEKRLSSVESGLNSLKEVGSEIQQLENITFSVKDQVHLIHHSLNRLGEESKRLKRLEVDINRLNHKSDQQLNRFQDAITQKSNEVFSKVEQKLEEIARDATDFQNQLREELMIKQEKLGLATEDNYSELESNLKQSSAQLAEDLISQHQSLSNDRESLKQAISKIRDELTVDLPKSMERIRQEQRENSAVIQEELSTTKKSIQEEAHNMDARLKQVFEEIDDQRTNLMQELLADSERLHQEFDQINLDSLEKKDEIVQAARVEARKVQSNIEKFQELYANARETLFHEATRREGELLERMNELETSSDNLIEKLNETKHQHLIEIQDSIQDSLKVIRGQAEEVFRKAIDNYQEKNVEILHSFQSLEEKIESVSLAEDERIQKSEERFEQIEESAKDQINEVLRKGMETQENYLADLEHKWQHAVDELDNRTRTLDESIQEIQLQSKQYLDERVHQLNDSVNQVEEKLQTLKGNLESEWRRDSDSIVRNFNESSKKAYDLFLSADEKINDHNSRIQKMINEHAQTFEKVESDLIEKLSTDISDQWDKMRQISQDWKEDNEIHVSEVMNRFKEKVENKEGELSRRMESITHTVTDMRRALETKQETIVDQLLQEKRGMERDIQQLSAEKLEDFENSVDQHFNDRKNRFFELVRESESQVETLRDDVIQQTESSLQSLDKELTAYRKEQRDHLEELGLESGKLNRELSDMNKAIKELKHESEYFDNLHEHISKVRELSADLDKRLDSAEDKNEMLESIYHKVEDLNKLRIKIEGELNQIAKRRDRIDNIEEQVQVILDLHDQIEERSTALNDYNEKLEKLMDSHSMMDKQQEKVDILMKDFLGQQELIESTINVMKGQSNSMNSISEDVERLIAIFEATDEKANKLREEFQSLDSNYKNLQKQSGDLDKIERRFLEVEDLLEDIDSKRDQLQHLKDQYTGLQNNIDQSVSAISTIEQNAETKIEQLSQFYTAINDKADQQPQYGNNGVGDKKDVVLRLGRLGWSAQEIATKVQMDEGTIQTILSTFSRPSLRG
jgi:chromosome segregation ATPase